MKISRVIPLFLIISLLTALFCPMALADEVEEYLDPFADTRPYVSSQYGLVADMDTGRVLYSKGGDVKHPPASITKIMTALLIIEAIERGEYDMAAMITAPEDCREGVPDEASTAGIVGGEIMSLEDILYCILLPSANEACNIIAEMMCGTREAFVEKMNARAQEIGCTNTHFNNPNGISNDNHYTTPYDLMLIGRECMRHEIFANIVGTLAHDIPATNKSEARHFTNSNALINVESFYGDHYVYEGAYGIKTGHTELAGYNLLTCVERGGVNLIAVVFGGYAYGTGFSNFTDSVNLYDWAFSEFGRTKVLDKGAVLGSVGVIGGVDENSQPVQSVDLVAMEDAEVTCGSLFDGSLQKNVRVFRNELNAPVEAGAVLGEVSFTDAGGAVYGRCYLVAADSVAADPSIKPDKTDGGHHAWLWILLAVLLAVVAVILYLRGSYRRHQAARAAQYDRGYRR